MEIAALAVSILAMAGTVIAAVVAVASRRDAQAAGAQAASAQMAAVDALAQAADAQQRLAAIAEEQARPDPPRVQWRARRTGDSQMTITNVGNIRARNTTISAEPPESAGMVRAPEHPDLEPGESYSFLNFRAMGGNATHIVVTWLDETADHGLEQKIRLDGIV